MSRHIEAQHAAGVDATARAAEEHARRIIALSRFIGLHHLAIERLLLEHDAGRGPAEHPRIRIKQRLEQDDRSFWRMRLRIRPFLDDLSRIYSGAGLYSATNGPGNLQDGSTFSRKTRKYWVPPEAEHEVMVRLVQHMPLYYFDKRIPKKSRGTALVEDPATTSVYLDSANFELFHSRLRRDDGAVALRLRVYADESLRAVGDAANGNCSRKVFVERKTHREEVESVKERFALPVDATDALLDVANGQTVSAGSLGLSGSTRKAQKDIQLASEVIQLIRSLQLRPSIVTRYLRICYQREHDDTLRISLDRDFIMINESPMGQSGTGWRWRDDIAAQSKASHVFPYSVLEIKLREDQTIPDWFKELLHDGLVIDMAKYSKFLHGVSMLKQPSGAGIPYWLTRDLSGQLVFQGDAVLSQSREQWRQARQQQQEKEARTPSHEQVLNGSNSVPGTCAAYQQASDQFNFDGTSTPPGCGQIGVGSMQFSLESSAVARSSVCCCTCGGSDDLDDGLLMYGDELSAVAERTHEQHKSRWCMAGAEHYNNIRANPSLACAHLAISTDLGCHTFGILAAAAADDDATSVATCTSLNEARRCYCDILYGLRTQLIIQSQSEKPQASCRTKNVYGEVTSFAIVYSIRRD
eukprot:COSAG02_NODE_5763_length_4059_cov_5.780808_3_plen_639_part_00